jgi:hypothetical protein
MFSINLDWPAQITETEFFKRVKEMPKAKIYGFLSSSSSQSGDLRIAIGAS